MINFTHGLRVAPGLWRARPIDTKLWIDPSSWGAALAQTGNLGGEAVLVLIAAAFLTAALSAIVGMAGGMILLSVMLLRLDPLVAIPLHAAVQLVSNGSRAFIQRHHVRRDIAWRYALLLVPMGFAGIAFAEHLSPEIMRSSIGVFVLLATWAPQVLLLGTHPENTDPNKRFFALGGLIGFLNVSLGATGPLSAPFFLNLGLSQFALIGTMATCQMLGHLSKVFVFGVVGFAFGEYAALLAILALMVTAGSWSGSQLLQHVNERAFVVAYKTILTLIALRLVVLELIKLNAAA